MGAPYIPTQCSKCKHFTGMVLIDAGEDMEADALPSCKAFEKGIPDAIADGEFDHTKPYKGDNGIRFEPIQEKI